jgi:hypothetical protein
VIYANVYTLLEIPIRYEMYSVDDPDDVFVKTSFISGGFGLMAGAICVALISVFWEVWDRFGPDRKKSKR